MMLSVHETVPPEMMVCTVFFLFPVPLIAGLSQ